MKFFIALILSVALTACTGDVFTGNKRYQAKDNEELYGTWVSMVYQARRPPQELIFRSDGSFSGFVLSTSQRAKWFGTFKIIDKWTDSEGNIYYKTKDEGDWGEKFYTLYKISDSGKTMEYVYKHFKYPIEIDPKSRHYRKYYRK